MIISAKRRDTELVNLSKAKFLKLQIHRRLKSWKVIVNTKYKRKKSCLLKFELDQLSLSIPIDFLKKHLNSLKLNVFYFKDISLKLVHKTGNNYNYWYLTMDLEFLHISPVSYHSSNLHLGLKMKAKKCENSLRIQYLLDCFKVNYQVIP